MSARTNLTVRSQSAYPEVGPATKTLENMDVTNGNKLALEPGLAVVLQNTSGTSKTVTFTYDDDAGEIRTKVLTLAAGELTVAQLEARLARHASDTAEAGFAWFTANGVAGDVKAQAVRLKNPLAV
jgi:hypothetical protein